MSNTTKSSIFRRTFIQDAGSYIIPVLIVLIAILFSMGNVFSVNAVESHQVAPTHQTVKVSGSAGINVTGTGGITVP